MLLRSQLKGVDCLSGMILRRKWARQWGRGRAGAAQGWCSTPSEAVGSLARRSMVVASANLDQVAERRHG